MNYRSLIAKMGQKVQLSADIYPKPKCKFKYKWEITKGKDIASVDDKGVLTVSPLAIPGDTFTVKTTAVIKDPYIKPKASIVKYLVV
jgi:hypothetical protein